MAGRADAPRHRRDIVALSFSPDGKTLVVANANVTNPGGEVGLWDLADATLRRMISFDEARMEPHRLCFLPDGKHLVVGDFKCGCVGIFAL